MDYQQIANDVGAAVRAAEAAADAEGATNTKTALTTLHGHLNDVYLAFKELLDEVGEDELDWSQIAGQQPGHGAQTHSGGGGKKEPQPGHN